MKKALKNGQGTILLFMLAMTAIVTIVLFASQVELRTSLLQLIKKVVANLGARSDAWLLYVGTITLAIYYLRLRRWIISSIIFFIGLLWIGYYGSTIGFVSHLGADSFHEAGAFDTSEALFWFNTFATQLQFSLSLKAFVLYNGIALGFYAALLFYASLGYRSLRTHFHVLQPVVASIFITTALYQSVGGGAEMFYENSRSFENVAEKFENATPPATTSKNINVLLYLGESTSIMNMELYGYSRNNTPLLSELEQTDESLLKFENVFATHTHTSPSLLEALSIGLYRDEDRLPITDRRRISIVDILNVAGVGSELYSNQGQTGTWNFASSIVFKNAGKTVFSTDSKAYGNADYKLKKPWDDEFFRAQLQTEDLDNKSSALVVFHSYA
jgi:glucan phosphoethanolaminetransferase (alkaline phosphatase superfamily)